MTAGGSADDAVWRRLALGRVVVDRAAHRRIDPEWLAKAWVRARVLVIDDYGRFLVTGGPAAAADEPAAPAGPEESARPEVAGGPEAGGGPRLAFVAAPDAPDGERVFLGVDAHGPYFAVLGPLPEVPAAWPASLREVAELLDDHDAALLAETVGVANWHRAYRYSPATGAPLVWQAAGWEGVPADDSGVVWPRTNPAVIVLVHDGVAGDGGRCLLTRAASWPAGRYSCVAGFVEPGESAEAAVGREVLEETGVVVGAVRYVPSQPWPLPASLMLGFYALADSGQEVVVDQVELEDARWFTRGELLGRGDGPALVPPSSISISHELITRWRDER